MQLHFKAYGEGYPLIILHGLFGSLNNWVTLSRRWGEHFRVYGVDQRNHGHSPHSPDMDFTLMADDLRELMDNERIRQAHLLGHSMGGKTAMAFALRYPERTNGLVAIDVSPRRYPRGHDEILDAMTAFDPSSVSSRAQADAALQVALPDAAVRQFILTNLAQKPGGGYKWKLNLDALRADYDAIIDAVASDTPFPRPALFVIGGRSHYVEEADRALISQLFPRAEFVTIPGAGHWVHAERPEELYQIVLRFLQRLSDSSSHESS